MIVFFRVQDIQELATNIDLASLLQQKLASQAAVLTSRLRNK